MNNLYLLVKAIEANSTKGGAEMDLTLSATSRVQAESWIREVADALHRTYQEIVIGETKTAYFEIVKHDIDPISFSVHFEVESEEVEPKTLSELWKDVKAQLEKDVEDSKIRLGEKLAAEGIEKLRNAESITYEVIDGPYSQAFRNGESLKRVDVSLENISKEDAEQYLRNIKMIAPWGCSQSVTALISDMKEGKRDGKYSKIYKETAADSADESPGEVDRDFGEVDPVTVEKSLHIMFCKADGYVLDEPRSEPFDNIDAVRRAVKERFAAEPELKIAKVFEALTVDGDDIDGRFVDWMTRDDFKKSESQAFLLGAMIEASKEESTLAERTEQKEVKRILTESKLVDLEFEVRRKRRHKMVDVVKLIHKAHKIGKGDF